MIDIRLNEVIINKIQENLDLLDEPKTSLEILNKMNLLVSLQILNNQSELSKQLQSIKNNLPYKPKGNIGPG